ncbi:unnamed protein product, partial [Musa textilis]
MHRLHGVPRQPELLEGIQVEYVGGASRVDHNPLHLGVGHPSRNHQRVVVLRLLGPLGRKRDFRLGSASELLGRSGTGICLSPGRADSSG